MKVSNSKSEMIVTLILRIFNQLVSSFCMRKGGTTYLMYSIDHPTAK